MMRHEFEERIEGNVTADQYKKIEKVYLSYPGIKDKDHIAQLYETFGMVIIDDMLKRAEDIQELESKIREKKQEINQLEQQKQELEGGF